MSATRFALRGDLTTVGTDPITGEVRAIVQCTREAILAEPRLPMYAPVVIVEAKWLDVEAPLNGADALANAAKVIEAGEKERRELLERIAVLENEKAELSERNAEQRSRISSLCIQISHSR